MLYQNFGLDRTRTHHGVEHNRASARPVPTLALNSKGSSFAASCPRGDCHDVAG
jgi:hypothetical protein